MLNLFFFITCAAKLHRWEMYHEYGANIPWIHRKYRIHFHASSPFSFCCSWGCHQTHLMTCSCVSPDVPKPVGCDSADMHPYTQVFVLNRNVRSRQAQRAIWTTWLNDSNISLNFSSNKCIRDFFQTTFTNLRAQTFERYTERIKTNR